MNADLVVSRRPAEAGFGLEHSPGRQVGGRVDEVGVVGVGGAWLDGQRLASLHGLRPDGSQNRWQIDGDGERARAHGLQFIQHDDGHLHGATRRLGAGGPLDQARGGNGHPGRGVLQLILELGVVAVRIIGHHLHGQGVAPRHDDRLKRLEDRRGVRLECHGDDHGFLIRSAIRIVRHEHHLVHAQLIRGGSPVESSRGIKPGPRRQFPGREHDLAALRVDGAWLDGQRLAGLHGLRGDSRQHRRQVDRHGERDARAGRQFIQRNHRHLERTAGRVGGHRPLDQAPSGNGHADRCVLQLVLQLGVVAVRVVRGHLHRELAPRRHDHRLERREHRGGVGLHVDMNHDRPAGSVGIGGGQRHLVSPDLCQAGCPVEALHHIK